VLCVCWYLRCPLAYEHVSKLLAERGVEVDPSFIWRWVQVYAPELRNRCRPHPMETAPSGSSKEVSREHHIRRRSFSHTLRKISPTGRRLYQHEHRRRWDSRECCSRFPSPGVVEAEPHSVAQHRRRQAELQRNSMRGRQDNDRRRRNGYRGGQRSDPCRRLHQ